MCRLNGGREPVARVFGARRVHAQAAVLTEQDEGRLLFPATAAPVPDGYHVCDLCFGWYDLLI